MISKRRDESCPGCALANDLWTVILAHVEVAGDAGHYDATIILHALALVVDDMLAAVPSGKTRDEALFHVAQQIGLVIKDRAAEHDPKARATRLQ